MTETLLSISEVLLYGQVLTDMEYSYDKPAKGQKDRALESAFKLGPDTKFARIFGFSYEGGYYDMDAPIIMTVNGKGEGIKTSNPPKDVENAFANDMRVWSYDKSDSSIRLDTLAGTIEDILLEVEIGGGMDGGRVSGGRVSGGRVSGGRVSGGRVSGGRVSGGRVSGGRVSGGKSD
jgi:hypothetical protein